MKFDLIILGAGSGGIATAVRAASYGAKVAVIEQAHLGGTCVNLGCVPKKVMYNAAWLSEMLNKSSHYGFSPGRNSFDWQVLVSKRNNYISKLRENYANRLREYKITAIQGKGSLVNSKTISVADKYYQAQHILIATGGEPLTPRLAGAHYTIDSNGFFSLTSQPSKVAVIGSGYIGVELAGILHELGTKTHLLIRGKKLLSRFDDLLGDTLVEIMANKGIGIHLEHHAQSIQLQKNGKKLITCKNGFQLSDLDEIIVAVGRKPCTFDLNLNALNVICDKQGLIKVDRYQNTSVPGIYALGDVTQSPALTPVAIGAGRKLADRLFGGQTKAHLNYQNICSVIFSHPPIATVGLSEKAAINKFGKEQIKIYQTCFNPMLDALCENKTPTIMKLITKGAKEKIIGLHIIGYNADEMLQGFGVAIKMGACKKDFDRTVAIHPTSAEELVTLR